MQRMVSNLSKNVGQLVWIVIIAIAAVIMIGSLLLSRPEVVAEPEVFQLTLEAAGTAANVYVPTLSANLTQTPADAALTGAAPTLALSGRLEVRLWAASAQASSERDLVNRGAVQAVGPPNTEECGDYTTAWASANPNGSSSITLLFAELVTPTGVQIYESQNPGFITRVEFIDHLGGIHVIYEATPGIVGLCPFIRVIPVEDADYKGNRLTIYVNQVGGWNMIDAVQLIGIKHN